MMKNLKKSKKEKQEKRRRSFEILGHTADLRLRVFGKTREELFRNALLGLASILKPGIEAREKKVKESVKIRSQDTGILLVDFLNEVLAKSQINKAVYKEVHFEEFTETEIKAEIFGSLIEEFDEDIKAVSYHDVRIRQSKRGILQVELVFDI